MKCLLRKCLLVHCQRILLALTTASGLVFAEIPVIDRIPMGGGSTGHVNGRVEAKANVVQKSNQQSEMYYQIQLLQQDILQLRGLIEQQAHELKKVKQQRLEDYMELDRRLSVKPSSNTSSNTSANRTSTSTTGSSAPYSSTVKSSSASVLVPNASVPNNRILNRTTTSSNVGGVNRPVVVVEPEPETVDPQAELKQYRQAIDLVLKKKNYEQAKQSLNKHLSDYPNGRYAANSHYWLGEIYLQQKNFNEAQTWFSSLLQSFPSHSKVEDAKFKLAQVYIEKGEKNRARPLLEAVADSDKSVAQLARNYLDKYFPDY